MRIQKCQVGFINIFQTAKLSRLDPNQKEKDEWTTWAVLKTIHFGVPPFMVTVTPISIESIARCMALRLARCQMWYVLPAARLDAVT